jgi:hypothetical protein
MNRESVTADLSSTRAIAALPPPTRGTVANMELIDDKDLEQNWVQGLPLVMVTMGITLVVFLMLLDTAILATVGITLYA